jgi:hypothetical protein
MKLRYIIIGAAVIFICWLVFNYVHDVSHKFSGFFNEDQGISNTFSNEYLNLFSEQDQKKLSNRYSYSSALRSPFAIADYDSSYTIIIHKMPLGANLPVGTIIQDSNGAVKETTNLVYGVIDQTDFKLKYKSGGTKPVSKIFITFDEKNRETMLRNDSVLYYYLPKGAFSVRYGLDSAVDFYIESKEPFDAQSKLPKTLLFMKRNGSLFFFMMFPIKEDVKFPINLLYSMLTQNH